MGNGTDNDGPKVLTEIPGPRSRKLLEFDDRHMSGGSAYPDMFGTGLRAPVFVASEGCYLIDADGNRFLETSGTYSIGVLGYSPRPLHGCSLRPDETANACAQYAQPTHA